MSYSVYSLADTHTVINHPSVGQKVLSDEENGGGDITIDYTGDMSQHQQTSNGFTVISKLRSRAGTISIQVAQNSQNDEYLSRWISYLASAPAGEFAQTVMTVKDDASGKTYNASGVTPQKRPTRQYSAQSGMLTYVLLCASITEN